MIKRLIFVVESDQQSKTDQMYIQKHIKKRGLLNHNLDSKYIFLGGKAKYKDKKVLKEINKYIQDIRKFNPDAECIVIYCIDLDKHHIIKEQKKLNDEIIDYCNANGYKFIWFLEDIESVYLGKPVENKSKIKEAKIFARKPDLDVGDSKFRATTISGKNKSNIENIFKEIEKSMNE